MDTLSYHFHFLCHEDRFSQNRSCADTSDNQLQTVHQTIRLWYNYIFMTITTQSSPYLDFRIDKHKYTDKYTSICSCSLYICVCFLNNGTFHTADTLPDAPSWKKNLLDYFLPLVLPSWAGRDVDPTSPGGGSSDVSGVGISDWLMLLVALLQKMSAWLLPELDVAFGAQSLSGCFFWMSVTEGKW